MIETREDAVDAIDKWMEALRDETVRDDVFLLVRAGVVLAQLRDFLVSAPAMPRRRDDDDDD